MLARFERRAVRQLLEAPALVVAFDELGDGRAHLGEVSKDPAVDGLLLERAIPTLDDAVGFRFFNEGEAGVDAPVPKLIEEVVRQILAGVIHPQRQPAGHVRLDRAVESPEPDQRQLFLPAHCLA